MSNKVEGKCLCGEVGFEVEKNFKVFYQCHCKQCQVLTGSAFASNLFTNPDNISWLKGREFVTKYEHPSREFSKAFCKICGSALPYINKGKTSLIIPAGSLNSDISKPLDANIFVSEKVCRSTPDYAIKEFESFPE